MVERLNGQPGPAASAGTPQVHAHSFGPLPGEDYYARSTWASFRLDGIDVTHEEVTDALAPAPERPALRSRQAMRLRNHAAILHHIEIDLRQAEALDTDTVIRWYTGISAGLSTTGLDGPTSVRLDEAVRRINSPQLRMQAALQEIAQTYLRLMADPLVPSFNGILARLLLRYHLGRCRLPPVIFDPALDGRIGPAEGMARRLVELLEGSFEGMLKRGARS